MTEESEELSRDAFKAVGDKLRNVLWQDEAKGVSAVLVLFNGNAESNIRVTGAADTDDAIKLMQAAANCLHLMLSPEPPPAEVQVDVQQTEYHPQGSKPN